MSSLARVAVVAVCGWIVGDVAAFMLLVAVLSWRRRRREKDASPAS